jgi:hypothetical protein
MTNENKVEETTETNDEELETTEDESTEEVDELEEETNEDDDTPSTSDYDELQKKLKTIEAQKEHWRKKATSKPKEKEELKTNDDYLTRDEAILLTKGYDEDDIQQLKRVAGDNNLIEASKDPMFKAYKREKEQKEKSSKAQLSSSNKPVGSKKAISEMSDEEHKAFFYKTLNK